MRDGPNDLPTRGQRPEARAETAVAEPCKVLSHARELQYFCAACIACLRWTAGANEAPVLIMCTIAHMDSHAIRSLFKTAHL